MASPRIRKRIAFLLGSAMAVGSVNAATPPADDASVETRAFEAPDGTMILTRELRRIIVPGKEVVTRRSYTIRFIREGAGWRVEGTLANTEVEAPAELAMLASLEKARKDDGLFPLRLDSHGMIVSQQGARDLASAQQAQTVVTNSVKAIPMPDQDKAVAAQMVSRIAAQSGAIGGNWPTDLFRPKGGPRKQVREVPLPDGRQGRVTVTMQANPDSRGLMEHFERSVLTELGGTSRLSQETWRLTDAQ
ncbi:MAG: hypothetical protein ACKOPQ_10430 [Novosphingobium sp.]